MNRREKANQLILIAANELANDNNRVQQATETKKSNIKRAPKQKYLHIS